MCRRAGVSFEITAFPFRAGDIAALVGGEVGSEPPAAGNLPGRESLGEEVGQVRDGDWCFGVEGGDNGVGAVGVIISILDADDDAFDDGRMGAEDAFDGLGGGFAAGDIEKIRGATVEENEIIAELSEVGGFETAGVKGGLRIGKVSFGDSGAFDDESA